MLTLSQELQLPKSIITRLAKGVLPPNTQIQANAILAMTKSATVFINHLANAYVSSVTRPGTPKGELTHCVSATGPTRLRHSKTRRPSCPPMFSGRWMT